MLFSVSVALAKLIYTSDCACKSGLSGKGVHIGTICQAVGLDDAFIFKNTV